MELADGLNIETAPPLAVGANAARKPKKHHKPHEDCQNCGAKLSGEYCHSCGQHGHVHRSMFHVIEEVFHGITHFDSRTWRSIPLLIFRPGTLTRNYVMGQRARYVPPFAMFLFSVFAMFLVFAFSGGPGLVEQVPTTKAEIIAAARDNVRDRESDLRDAQSEVVDAEKELADAQNDADAGPGDVGSATGQLEGARGTAAGAQVALDQARRALTQAIARPETAAPQAATKSQAVVAGGQTTTFNSQAEKGQALAQIATERESARKDGNTIEQGALALAEQAVKSAPVAEAPLAAPTAPNEGAEKSKLKVKVEAEASGVEVKLDSNQAENIMTMMKDSMRRGEFIVTPWPEINKKINDKTKNPDLFVYKLQNTVYKFSFLLVPLSLPFIWIMLFWKKNVTLFDHAVFSLYSLSFVSFVFIAISLGARFLPVGQLFGLAALIMPIHIFFQFKGAYLLGWFGAFWRTALFCTVSSWVVLTLFLLSIIALGVTG